MTKKILGSSPRHGKSIIRLDRMHCPNCGYPMKVLEKREDNIYQCYCASCKEDIIVKVVECVKE